ncbi:DUF2459 domain-containing protein [Plastoroseomonas arctica]|uniref:DUF2459 domain-containing protein n=1 Tax=Plastoroseomonas arctica TaxID=1509237 RepID=A0AAF1KM74_9PROT|nr:DUF2459 domain-containing protein [Plastoroseomonas arctica]MBR0655931.1 DUF2459 domain-containing protein [Plastoroseomonas arctica]
MMPGPTRRAVLAAMPLLACSRLDPPQFAGAPDCACAEALSVVRRSWHTDVAFEARALPPRLEVVARELPNAAWLSVGFGDRAWFTEDARGPLPMLNALFGGPAALLVTGLPSPPERAFAGDEQVGLAVSTAGREALLRFLDEQIEATRPIAPGPYEGSLFYGTRLRYAATYTCNTWTADALRSAGLPINPNGVLLASQVMAAARALS